MDTQDQSSFQTLPKIDATVAKALNRLNVRENLQYFPR